MSGSPSATGFGFQEFGHFLFGHADWPEEVTWKILPQHHKDNDAKGEFVPVEPLRKLINSYKPQLQTLIDKMHAFPDLWDARKIPLDQLASLAYNFDIPVSAIQTPQETVFTVGSTAATLDLSTLSVAPPARIQPGTFKLSAFVVGYNDAVAVARDDTFGNLSAGVLLPSPGTIDYDTGALTGITNILTADSIVSVSYVYTIKDENLLRSFVISAIQFFVTKGLDSGYAAAGSFSGFLTTVTPLWFAGDDDTGAIQEAGPTEFFPRFDTFPADAIAADSVFTDFYAAWPYQLDWLSPRRTASLRLFFQLPPGVEVTPEEYSVLTEDVFENVARVLPIHVRSVEYRFEGPAAVGGGWTIPVSAGGGAVGGGWSIPVASMLSATGGGWSIPGVGTTTP